MVRKIYGQHIATYKWSHDNKALLDRTLEVYKIQKGYKAVLWNSGLKGWRGDEYKPLSMTHYKDLADIPIPKGVEAERDFTNYGTFK